MNLLTTLRNKIGNYVLAILAGTSAVILLTCLWGLFGDTILPPAIIARPAPNVTTITVPEPIFSERVIKTYIKQEDHAAVTALKKENAQLKIDVQTLSIALAQYQGQGSGVIIVNDLSNTTGVPAFTFKDWRLMFRGEGTTASYTLTQQFKIYNTVGKTRHGITTNLIRLYEVGPNNQQFPVPTVETTTFVQPPPTEGWYTKLSVQGGWAGLSIVSANTPSTPTGTGVVALPWLKHGTTRATEETRWAFLTPALAVSKTERTVGLLPVSFNLGTLRHQPFSNVWVSPFIGTTTGATVNRAGFVLSVTF